MTLFPKTMRIQIGLVIGLMGCISLAAIVLIVNFFGDQAIEHEKSAYEQLVKNEYETLIKDHDELLKLFALRIQKNKKFKNAVKTEDEEVVKELIDDEFAQYFITTGTLNINKIIVYDSNYNLVAESTRGNYFDLSNKACTPQLNAAKTRKGVKRIVPFSSLCYVKHHFFNTIVVPVNTLSPVGFIRVFSEPQNILSQLSEKVGMPIQILTPEDDQIFISDNWNYNKLQKNTITLEHVVKDFQSVPSLKIQLQKDISQLRNSLISIKRLIFLSVGGLVIISIIIIMYIFNISIIKPLTTLSLRLTGILDEKDLLSSRIPLSGSIELRSVIRSFNSLTDKLARSYHILENMAFTDQLTT